MSMRATSESINDYNIISASGDITNEYILESLDATYWRSRLILEYLSLAILAMRFIILNSPSPGFIESSIIIETGFKSGYYESGYPTASDAH